MHAPTLVLAVLAVCSSVVSAAYKTTGTGVWTSTGPNKTVVISTASAGKKCGPATSMPTGLGTRTVCATGAGQSCKYISKGYSTCRTASIATAKPSSTSGPDGGIKDILTAHNNARKPRGANPLKWSDELEKTAKAWAEKCIWEHGGANGAGQNLAAAGGSGGSAKQSGQQIVDSWMSEEKDYNPKSPTYSHFTQVVWKASTHLGCYQARCSKFVNGKGELVFPQVYLPAVFTVCNYSPAGNYIGQFQDNVTKL